MQSIIIAGVSDVWSAIRNNTVSRITTFIEFLPLAHFEDIFLKFAAVSALIIKSKNNHYSQ